MTSEEAKEYMQLNKSVLQRVLQRANEDLDADRVQDYNLALGRLFEAFDVATEALTEVERYQKAIHDIKAEINTAYASSFVTRSDSTAFTSGLELAFDIITKHTEKVKKL